MVEVRIAVFCKFETQRKDCVKWRHGEYRKDENRTCRNTKTLLIRDKDKKKDTGQDEE